MTRLSWDDPGIKGLNSGVSNAVLFGSRSYGIPWRGFTGVTKTDASSTSVPVYLDGVKVNEDYAPGSFAATISAYTYPDLILSLLGEIPISGVVHTDQHHVAPMRFDLIYREKVGPPNSSNQNYRYHIMYNLKLMPSTRTNTSETQSVTPELFTWELRGIAETTGSLDAKDTVHVYFDTRYMSKYLAQAVEDKLYGTETTNAYLPGIEELSSFATGFRAIVFTILSNGEWKAVGPDDLLTTFEDDSFRITQVDATYLDANTYTARDT